jgi:SAM-dependent methyltransferase
MDEFLEKARSKWHEVPAGYTRISTLDLEKLSDADLLQRWSELHADATREYDVRGWFHEEYSKIVSGKRVLEVGCGLGHDGITLAKAGAHLTFLDVVESNVHVVQRICAALGIDAEFLFVRRMADLQQLSTYDFIWCSGSMINAPAELLAEERALLTQHLAQPGGRWVELGYPKERWEREGCPHFSKWGDSTDGGAPWIEWYDTDKMIQCIGPVSGCTWKVLKACNFHNDDFNWFDLQCVSN